MNSYRPACPRHARRGAGCMAQQPSRLHFPWNLPDSMLVIATPRKPPERTDGAGCEVRFGPPPPEARRQSSAQVLQAVRDGQGVLAAGGGEHLIPRSAGRLRCSAAHTGRRPATLHQPVPPGTAAHPHAQSQRMRLVEHQLATPAPVGRPDGRPCALPGNGWPTVPLKPKPGPRQPAMWPRGAAVSAAAPRTPRRHRARCPPGSCRHAPARS